MLFIAAYRQENRLADFAKTEVRKMAQANYETILFKKENGLTTITFKRINGWCFGGAFTIVTACDIAIAAEDAVFGLSEVNFGNFPGGEVTRVLTEQLQPKHALFYALTGKTLTAKEAERIGLITKAVPRAELDKEVTEIANNLLEKDPVALRAVKEAWYYTLYATDEIAYEISNLISDRIKAQHGGRPGIKQFAEKQYRPGLGAYKWEK